MNDIIGPQKGRKGVRFDTRVPMKYTLKSALMQTQTKNAVAINMSDNGIRFECKEQLPPEAEIHIEILLSKTSKILPVGKVIRSVKKKDPSCYETALTFTEISNAATEEINMWYYSQKLMPNPSAAYVQETRKRTNNQYGMGKSFAEYRKKKLIPMGPWKQAEIKQIGQHELLLSTNSLPKNGEIWEILMHMPEYSNPVKAVGKVVSAETKGQNLIVLLEIIKMRTPEQKNTSEFFT